MAIAWWIKHARLLSLWPGEFFRAPLANEVDGIEMWWARVCLGRQGHDPVYPMSRKPLAFIPSALREWGKNGTFLIMLLLSWLVHAVWTAEPYSREREHGESDEVYTADVLRNSPEALKTRLRALADDIKWVFDQIPALVTSEQTIDGESIDMPGPSKRPRVQSPARKPVKKRAPRAKR